MIIDQFLPTMKLALHFRAGPKITIVSKEKNKKKFLKKKKKLRYIIKTLCITVYVDIFLLCFTIISSSMLLHYRLFLSVISLQPYLRVVFISLNFQTVNGYTRLGSINNIEDRVL